MNNLEIFRNEEFGEIRSIKIDDEIYFVGRDVAMALGYSDPSSAVSKNVDEEDKTTLLLEQDGSNYKSRTSVINESGLYSLILSSKLPNAKKFKHWVTSEVLPSIRKHGKYEMPKNPFETLRLMFDVVEDHENKIDNMSKDIFEIKENAPLNPGEYSYIGGLIGDKVRKIIRELGINHFENRDVKKELFKSINGEIKKITGIDTRSQLRQRDFKMVADFIRNWEPSKATMIVINNLRY